MLLWDDEQKNENLRIKKQKNFTSTLLFMLTSTLIMENFRTSTVTVQAGDFRGLV